MDIETYLGQESVRESLMWHQVGGVDCIVHTPDDHSSDTTGEASVDSGLAPVVLTLIAVAVTSEWFNRLYLRDCNEWFHVLIFIHVNTG